MRLNSCGICAGKKPSFTCLGKKQSIMRQNTPIRVCDTKLIFYRKTCQRPNYKREFGNRYILVMSDYFTRYRVLDDAKYGKQYNGGQTRTFWSNKPSLSLQYLIPYVYTYIHSYKRRNHENIHFSRIYIQRQRKFTQHHRIIKYQTRQLLITTNHDVLYRSRRGFWKDGRI